MIPFFPRGNGPLCSVLMPSRGRPGLLAQAIDSLWSLAKDKGNVEILVKADEDDKATIDVVGKIKKFAPEIQLRLFVTPRGRGYLDIHHWYNDILAPESKGDWLWIFNDDAVVETQDWDQILAKLVAVMPWHPYVGDVFVAIAETNGDQQSNESVILRRCTYEIMGHCFLSPYGDSWLVRVMEMVESLARLTHIKVKHKRKEVQDQTRIDTDASHQVGIDTLNSEPAIRARIKDATVLLDYIAKRNRETEWTPHPRRPGWCYWKPDVGGKGRFVYVNPDDTVVLFTTVKDVVTVKVKDMAGHWKTP